jgi:hypothetical protein
MERELANVGDFNAVVDYAEVFASFVGDFVDVRRVRGRTAWTPTRPELPRREQACRRRESGRLLRHRLPLGAGARQDMPCRAPSACGVVGGAGEGDSAQEGSPWSQDRRAVDHECLGATDDQSRLHLLQQLDVPDGVAERRILLSPAFSAPRSLRRAQSMPGVAGPIRRLRLQPD